MFLTDERCEAAGVVFGRGADGMRGIQYDVSRDRAEPRQPGWSSDFGGYVASPALSRLRTRLAITGSWLRDLFDPRTATGSAGYRPPRTARTWNTSAFQVYISQLATHPDGVRLYATGPLPAHDARA